MNAARLFRQRLNRMRLEERPRLLPLLRPLPHARSRRHHEQRHVIATPLLRLENVVAQTQPVLATLPPELERLDRRRPAGREQMHRVPVALGLEELPHSLHLHEARGLLFHLFHVVKEFEGLLIVFRQGLLEILYG